MADARPLPECKGQIVEDAHPLTPCRKRSTGAAGRRRRTARFNPEAHAAEGTVDREGILRTAPPGEGTRKRDDVVAQLLAPVVVRDDATEGIAPALQVMGVDQM